MEMQVDSDAPFYHKTQQAIASHLNQKAAEGFNEI